MMNAEVHFISLRLVLIELDKCSCLNCVTCQSIFCQWKEHTHIYVTSSNNRPQLKFLSSSRKFYTIQCRILQQLNINTDEMKGERDDQHEKALSERCTYTFVRSNTNIDCIKECKPCCISISISMLMHP